MNPLRQPQSEKSAIVLLGAGRPVRGGHPSAIQITPDERTVLDWITEACGELEADWHFVGGYHFEEISAAYPRINYSINPDWRETGSCASLFFAPLNSDYTHYISYTDIIFNRKVVNDLRHASGDIVLAVDTSWRDRYERRTQADLFAAEKVCLEDGTVTAIGQDMDVDRANAEYVGLMKVSPKAMKALIELRDQQAEKYSTLTLPDLITALSAAGLSVQAIDVEGNWAELNAPQDLARYVLGTKAETLARLRPMVRHSIIGDQISFPVVQWKDAPRELLENIQEKFGNAPLAVRSSALSEDGWTGSNAGAFLSFINVPSKDTSALSEAIQKVTDSYSDSHSQNQVLVQKAIVEVRISGVAFTRTLNTGAPYYVINYDSVSGRSDTVTGGSGRQLQTLIVHRSSTMIPSGSDPAFRKLLQALRELENLVGYDSLDVEFIISNNDRIEILQLRPIAVDHCRWKASDRQVAELLATARQKFEEAQKRGSASYGIMTDWNPAEIIGVKPRQLALSLYRFLITDETWAIQRAEYGYADVRPQPLMTTFMGHPFIDIRASFSSFVPRDIAPNLAERLIEFYLKALEESPHLHDKVEFDILFTCWSFDFSDQADRLRQNGFKDADIDSLETALKEVTRRGMARLEGDLDTIETCARNRQKILAMNTGSLEKAFDLLEDCRTFGALPFAHMARAGFIAITLLRSAVASGVIEAARQAEFMNSLNTVAKKFSHDGAAVEAGKLSMDGFCERYGHLRPGTYEITSEHYGANPKRYLEPAVHKSDTPDSIDDPFAWTAQEQQALAVCLADAGLEFSPNEMEAFMRKAIEGREYAKFMFTHNLSDALELLAQWGQENGLSREQVSYLDLQSLRDGLDDISPETLIERAQAGAHAHTLSQAVELPPLLMNIDDLSAFHFPESHPNFISTNKAVAPVVELGEHTLGTRDVSGCIVLIPQADPGYDWLFGQDMAGLVTMYGGANSHMAIRAAEFALPSAIGVGEAQYEALRRARTLELDCGTRQIHILQ